MDQLHIIAEDTISRTPEINASTPGASADSIFHTQQLSPLNKDDCPNFPTVQVRIEPLDSFATARKYINEDPTIRGKVAVLNLASDEYPGGGWRSTLCKTQEEALCYSSTLYATLKEEYYPWPNLGPGSDAGIYSPAITIFKDDLDHSCVDLPVDQREVVAVITVAAPRVPEVLDGRLLNSSDIHDLREKIKLIYRMAGHDGKQVLVLGAMGCGAYGCPPRHVAEEMKVILSDDEFAGWFKEVIFAVYPAGRTGQANYDVFKEVFEALES
jgi:uncharacterized protein (TIGR02452 family)